jgi:cytochrome d ubiquinol oxidase subunit II
MPVVAVGDAPDWPAILAAAGFTEPAMWARHLSFPAARRGIHKGRRAAAFAATIAHESGGGRILEENMRYSTRRLMEIWPRRFPTVEAARPFAWDPSDPDREDIALANHVYGARMGNQHNGTADDDGWERRGRGLIGLTGMDAALFPAAYLPLLIVIVAIVVRAVAIEYQSKRPGSAWRSRWDTAVALASLLLAFLFGLFWAGIVHGIPIDASGQFVGRSLMSFINPYSVLGGLTLLSFSLAHGATFLALKTAGPVQRKNEVWATRFDFVAGALMTAFAAWTYWSYSRDDAVALAIGILAVLGMLVALIANLRTRPLIAFWAHGVAIAAFVASMFVALYPNVLPSTLDPAASLTVEGAAASPYSLGVITVVAAVGLPMVIAYQAWSFWVFRKRITVEDAQRSHYA